MATTSEATHYQQYELLRRPDGSLWELGRGAMGTTYKAYDTNLRCTVALKVINTVHLDSDTAQQRFLREARAAAALRHPNVASVFNLGTAQDHCFYVMEFVDGETVEAYLKRQGPLQPAEALRLALQVARALAAAAKKQLVHRDLKPANLMLVDQEGEPVVKVIDFGLVKGVAGQSDESSRLTVGGGFVGTPYYASPEQVEDGEVDTRSDLYSLGATLYFLLTGQPPFAGSAGQVMSQHLYKPVPMGALAEVPGCVAALVQRLMEKDPRQRPQTAREVQEALLACLEQVCGPAAALELAAAPKGPLSPGTLVAQHYRLLEELGDSPQGRQFLAEDLRQQRRVSLLALSREFASDGPRLAALTDAVERVRQAPHRRLREVYGLETAAGGGGVLVEEHVGGPSLLEVLRCRGALSAPEVVQLVSRLAPLVDHARVHRLEHVELSLLGIYLSDPAASAGGSQSALLRQPLTQWPGLELKVKAIDFSFSCAPEGGGAAATQVTSGAAGGPRGSYVRLLGLLAYEVLGGPRARVEATGRYVPVAALGEGGNAALRRALADEWPSGAELARQLAAAAGGAGPAALASGSATIGGGREAVPEAAPARPLKECRFWGKRAPRRALALGLVISVGLGGYAVHRASHRVRVPVNEGRVRLAPGGPGAPAPSTAGPAMAAWDTVPPTVTGDSQAFPRSKENGPVTAAQPAPSPVQSAPPTPVDLAPPAPSAAWAKLDSALPPPTPGPTLLSAATPAEPEPGPQGGNGANPRTAVLPAMNASNPQALEDAAVLDQDGGVTGRDDAKEEQGIGRAQANPPAASTPVSATHRVPRRHVYRPRPPARPQPPLTFWQRLFGHNETKNAKSGKKPRH